MKTLLTVLSAFALPAALLTTSPAHGATPAPALMYQQDPGEALDEETLANIANFLDALTPLQGEIDLPRAQATLVIPDTHYFLASEDAQAVLTDAWGNPPDPTVLGMIFPAYATPLNDGVWGATVYFNDDGYISDADADKINYDRMIKDLKSSQEDNNIWRAENGYEPIEIVGWAEQPAYSAAAKKLYWAKELKFGDAPLNTLNYDIRVLGRKGALVISFIATMNELDAIRSDAPAVLEMASFNPGATYADYTPGVDKKAAYGIAGLIGGIAIAKKTGILAAILLFGKKFFVLFLVGIAAAFSAVRKFLVKKT